MDPSELPKPEQEIVKTFNQELNRIDKKSFERELEDINRDYFSALNNFLSKNDLSHKAICIMRQSALMRSWSMSHYHECSIDVCERIYDKAISHGDLSFCSFISISIIRARYLAEGGRHETALGVLSELESYTELHRAQYAAGEYDSDRRLIAEIRELMSNE